MINIRFMMRFSCFPLPMEYLFPWNLQRRGVSASSVAVCCRRDWLEHKESDYDDEVWERRVGGVGVSVVVGGASVGMFHVSRAADGIQTGIRRGLGRSAYKIAFGKSCQRATVR
jgi:hypothetical protein